MGHLGSGQLALLSLADASILAIKAAERYGLAQSAASKRFVDELDRNLKFALQAGSLEEAVVFDFIGFLNCLLIKKIKIGITKPCIIRWCGTFTVKNI